MTAASEAEILDRLARLELENERLRTLLSEAYRQSRERGNAGFYEQRSGLPMREYGPER